MTRTICRAAAMTLILTLAACAGGGERSKVVPPPDGGEVPPPPHAVDRIIQSADAMLMSDWVFSGVVDLRLRADCRRTTCTLSLPGDDEEKVSLSDFASESGDEWPAAGETYRGVSLVRESEISGIEDLIGEVAAYGGWLDHSLFMALSATARDEQAGDASYLFSMSIGAMTGTNPAPIGGSASWSGVMVGFDTDAGEVRGDADVTIADFMKPQVEVAFTRISDLDTGSRRDDMVWSDVPLADGGFAMVADGDSIQGNFYGPDHREIGGIFERGRVIGAFGGRRQPE